MDELVADVAKTRSSQTPSGTSRHRLFKTDHYLVVFWESLSCRPVMH